MNELLAEQIGIQERKGYWKANGQCFFDKSECLKYASTFYDCPVSYHYLDSVYRTLDWSKEPSADLDKLYVERAQQLRDKYDYLILSFSGGADSRNILRTFLDNNIKLDEIYTFQSMGPIEKLASTFKKEHGTYKDIIFEYLEATSPALVEVANHYPNIKITLEDITETAISIVDESKLRLFFRGGSTATPQTAGYYKLTELMRARSEKYQRVAAITGLDKPRIAYDKDSKKFISQYNDLTNAFADYADHGLDYKPVMENFYYTPDLPILNQKQCFVLKDAIINVAKNNPGEFGQLLYEKSPNPRIVIFNTHSNFFKKILYKNWDDTIWQAGKHSNFFYSAHTHWFYHTELTSEKTKDFYDKQVLELVHGINKRYIIYEAGKPALLKSYMTQPIYF